MKSRYRIVLSLSSFLMSFYSQVLPTYPNFGNHWFIVCAYSFASSRMSCERNNKYRALWAWFLSCNTMHLRFIHFVACISSSFFFITVLYSTVWICNSLSIRRLKDFSSFGWLWIKVLSAFVHGILCEHQFLLSKYLGMELLGHMVSVDLTLYKYAQLFSKVTVPFCDLPLAPAMPSLVSCVLAITW